jgi:hypothetical protein
MIKTVENTILIISFVLMIDFCLINGKSLPIKENQLKNKEKQVKSESLIINAIKNNKTTTTTATPPPPPPPKPIQSNLNELKTLKGNRMPNIFLYFI